MTCLACKKPFFPSLSPFYFLAIDVKTLRFLAFYGQFQLLQRRKNIYSCFLPALLLLRQKKVAWRAMISTFRIVCMPVEEQLFSGVTKRIVMIQDGAHSTSQLLQCKKKNFFPCFAPLLSPHKNSHLPPKFFFFRGHLDFSSLG